MKKELKALIDKISNLDSQLNKEDISNLEIVYYRITEVNRGKGKVLDKSCGACVLTARKMVYNLITYHMDTINNYCDWDEPKKVKDNMVQVSEETKEIIQDQKLIEATKEYESIFGKKPHHKTKLETILKKIENEKSK